MSARMVGNITELVGNTPLVRLTKVASGTKAQIYAKLEYLNPGGSVKDRIGISMILDAERRALLKPGGTIVEPTSGNTGMGLALAAIQRGYKIIFTLPDKMSKDKVDLLRAVGAEVRVAPTNVPPGHPAGYIELAKAIAKSTPNAFMPNQYENRANPAAHYATTGPEIWSQTRGKVGVLVAGVGTGGTISGAGRYLKEMNPAITIVGVDPEGSILAGLHAGRKRIAAPYKIEGIGEDFLPPTLDLKVVDRFVTVSDREAMTMTRRLAREEGILAGSSSGAAVAGALKVAPDMDARLMVVMLPDTGRSYLNKVYNDAWMEEQGFLPSSSRRVRVEALMRSKKSRRKLTTASPKDSLSKASKAMAAHGVSYLPVVEDDVQVGCLTASSLLVKIGGPSKRVEDAMEPPLPTVDLNGSVMVPGSLLGGRGAVVVTEKQKPVDVLTAIDVVKYVAKR